ncbi:hypothetical protein MCAV_01260 [[Mycoplasma] cavipharyngis]|uniref:hypothetical protein n=1 Tax=[Mycoplasma] cavipharyngis TaxID=92757 RepID=UPI003703C80F
MKKTKINIPFVLQRYQTETAIDPVELTKAELKKKILANTYLYDRFDRYLGRKIYTKPRYSNHTRSLMQKISKMKLDHNLVIGRSMNQNLINSIKANAYRTVIKQRINDLKFNYQSSFNNHQLPDKLDLRYIYQLDSVYKEFDQLSQLNQNLLGFNCEIRDYDNYQTSGADLASLRNRGLKDQDLIYGNHGQIFIDKQLFLKLTQLPFKTRKINLPSKDYEWTLPNYVKSLHYNNGKSTLFETKKFLDEKK